MPQSDHTSIRPVNGKVRKSVGKLPSGAFNYGLYFNKWFFVNCAPGKKECWSIEKKNFEDSVELFNDKKQIGGASHYWDRDNANVLLQERQSSLEHAARAWENLGYSLITLKAELSTPLIVGLGNEHPAEKGFRFDWTTGVPFIPSSGIKGVVRLAFIVNELNRKDEDEATKFWELVCRTPPILSANTDIHLLFGCGDAKYDNGSTSQEARKGGAIFLDAYPDTLPRLKAEIMNCHYKDYLNNKAERGPTEDQQPNPQKFWAVDRFADSERTKPLTFTFRVLVDSRISRVQDKMDRLQKAIEDALAEHGLGAKTAIGHGRFALGDGKASGEKATEDLRNTDANIVQVDPETARKKALEQFKDVVEKMNASDLPGKVESFTEKVKGSDSDALKKEMCAILHQKALALPKKNKLPKALANGKKWAEKMKKLFDECGYDFNA